MAAALNCTVGHVVASGVCFLKRLQLDRVQRLSRTGCRDLRFTEERFEADLRPGFEAAGVGQDFVERAKAGFDDVGFQRSHRGALDVEQVDHAQVDLADFGCVVVDQADARSGVAGVDRDFLGQLAAHAFFIGGRGMADVRRGQSSAEMCPPMPTLVLLCSRPSPCPLPRVY